MLVPEVREQIQKIREIYSEKVLPQRTRTVSLLGRKCEPKIMYTFLGYELKMNRKRLTCPDMSTARYLILFAEIGMPSVEIPYDPTQTARLLPELEKAFERVKQLLLDRQLDRTRHQAAVRRVCRQMRRELKQAGESRASAELQRARREWRE